MSDKPATITVLNQVFPISELSPQEREMLSGYFGWILSAFQRIAYHGCIERACPHVTFEEFKGAPISEQELLAAALAVYQAMCVQAQSESIAGTPLATTEMKSNAIH